ncbi:MAG: excinuclease ABC subunit UvrC [Eubacterium sp.]|nr:excinuclease ABC subunit UvrC [Eubacterium sp.]
MFDIQEELKKLPTKPGVYLMYNDRDVVIYVGKAVNLRNRVRQYFRAGKKERLKLYSMVPQIARFEYTVTDSEVEALVLECNLIKEFRPKYNTMLMDDKAYPFIQVTVQEAFPRVLYSHRMRKDKAQYYGPYPDAGAAKETIDLVRRLYHLRSCSRQLPEKIGKDRPCLYYHIHQCMAPCQGWITQEEYRQQIQEAQEFLNGKTDTVLKELKQQMKEAAEEMRFEEAASLRDLIASVTKIGEKQKMASRGGDDMDVIALAREEEDAIIQVFFVRDGRLIGRDHFYMKAAEEETGSGIMQSFIQQFYAGTPFIPQELMLSDDVEDAAVIEEWLSDKKGRKVHLHVPQKGTREKLVELARRNATIILTQDRERIKKEIGKTVGAIGEIGEWLSMEPPERIESYDISNTSGYQSVGSMVVYEQGKPRKADYRKFRIRTVEGPNDYASMEEVLSRRFRHGLEAKKGFERLPDLILMDGGKGQVNSCLKVLGELGLEIPVAGMVKDDRHRTRGLYYNNQEIPIERDSEGFHLITRIQDETHRFAIEYHRLLRSKAQVHSILDDIPYIGKNRRKELMRYFADIESIRTAELEELKKVPTMDSRSAQSVYDFFHKESGGSQSERQL